MRFREGSFLHWLVNVAGCSADGSERRPQPFLESLLGGLMRRRSWTGKGICRYRQPHLSSLSGHGETKT